MERDEGLCDGFAHTQIGEQLKLFDVDARDAADGLVSDNGRKTEQAERSQEPQPKPPDKSKNGPDYER